MHLLLEITGGKKVFPSKHLPSPMAFKTWTVGLWVAQSGHWTTVEWLCKNPLLWDQAGWRNLIFVNPSAEFTTILSGALSKCSSFWPHSHSGYSFFESVGAVGEGLGHAWWHMGVAHTVPGMGPLWNRPHDKALRLILSLGTPGCPFMLRYPVLVLLPSEGSPWEYLSPCFYLDSPWVHPSCSWTPCFSIWWENCLVTRGHFSYLHGKGHFLPSSK